MNLTGILPRLLGSDSLYSIKTYSEEMAARLEGGAWVNLTLNSGWEAVSGYPLQVRRYGALVELRGMVKLTGTYTAAITTIPARYRPTGSAVWMTPAVATVSKAVVQPFIPVAGALAIPGAAYTTATPAANDLIALRGFWSTDTP